MNLEKHSLTILVALAALWVPLALPGRGLAWNAGHDPALLVKQTPRPQTACPAVPLPAVEVPAAKGSDILTIFYSGDGGWRDLDRTVARDMAQQGYPVIGVDCLRGFWKKRSPEQASHDLARTMEYYRHHWGAKKFVLAGYSFGADILPPIYNRLSPADRDSVDLLVLLAFSKEADFEIHVANFLGKKSKGLPLAPEVARLPAEKLFCVYGVEEKKDTGCLDVAATHGEILELPGGHHFDQDYPKLTRLILERYQKAGLTLQP